MKAFTLYLFILLFLPFVASSQSVGDVLQKVSTTLNAEQWEQAVVLFRQTIQLNVDKAEMFYWTNVDKNSGVSSKMAQELAFYYKKRRSFDKAFLFYKELLQRKPNDVSFLVSCAEMEVARGKESEALLTYQQILNLDTDNLDANIFMGNYYYLMAEQQKQQLEKEYKKLTSPTRMQYAKYKNELSQLLGDGYVKARGCLQNVIQRFPSTEARKTLDKIGMIEKEINR